MALAATTPGATGGDPVHPLSHPVAGLRHGVCRGRARFGGDRPGQPGSGRVARGRRLSAGMGAAAAHAGWRRAVRRQLAGAAGDAGLLLHPAGATGPGPAPRPTARRCRPGCCSGGRSQPLCHGHRLQRQSALVAGQRPERRLFQQPAGGCGWPVSPVAPAADSWRSALRAFRPGSGADATGRAAAGIRHRNRLPRCLQRAAGGSGAGRRRVRHPGGRPGRSVGALPGAARQFSLCFRQRSAPPAGGATAVGRRYCAGRGDRRRVERFAGDASTGCLSGRRDQRQSDRRDSRSES